MRRKIATVLVEPRTLYREALSHLLANTSYKPISITSDLAAVARECAPETGELLLVIGAEGRRSATGETTLAAEIALARQRFPDARVVVLGGSFDAKDVVAALRAGADGYVLDTMSRQALISSFDLVMCGETVVPSEFARSLHSTMEPASAAGIQPGHSPQLYAGEVARAEPRALSRKEMSILSRLTLGDSNKAIARSIGIAEATVKAHVKAILRKIGARNRTQAAMWALNNLPGSTSLGLVPEASLLAPSRLAKTL